MKAKWAVSVCSVVLAFAVGAMAQNNGNGSSNDPVLKTRPADDNTPPPQPQLPPDYGRGNCHSGI